MQKLKTCSEPDLEKTSWEESKEILKLKLSSKDARIDPKKEREIARKDLSAKPEKRRNKENKKRLLIKKKQLKKLPRREKEEREEIEMDNNDSILFHLLC